jgi:multidrug resistance efflux pump
VAAFCFIALKTGGRGGRNMKRILRTILTILAISGMAVSVLACGSGSESTAVTDDKAVAVQRGDLTIDITAVGNLAFSHKEELAFEVGGRVAEVLVEAGDSVEEGQTLVRLDISEWEEQLDALRHSVTSAESGLTSAERGVTSAQRMLASRESSLLQAEIDLKNAQLALDSALTAEWTSNKENEIEIRELQVELAEMHLVEAQNAVLDALQAIADAEQAIADAQQEMVDAQEELAEATAISPAIKAPFDGLVTTVSVEANDNVQEGHVAVVLADPTEFEAEILVNEINIFDVRLGAQASIQVDALPGMSLAANVTSIAPTAIIQAGVVNYEVKVELESLLSPESSVPSDEQEQVQEMPGVIDEALDKAVEEGRISPEQADKVKDLLGQKGEGFSQEEIEQFIERFVQKGGGFSKEQMERFEDGTGLKQKEGGMILKGIQLREGLTVTVSIIIQERNDALLVPNQAIMGQGKDTYVQVLKEGVVEERSITIGISNWQYTEVIEGLSEGEKVIIGVTSTTTTSTEQKPGEKIPGIQRMLK